MQPPPIDVIRSQVEIALREDIGSGDVTAGLIDANARATAHVIAREHAVLCGSPWFDEVFHQIDDSVSISWGVADGDAVASTDRRR